MSAVILHTWSRRRAEGLVAELKALELLSPPDPTPRPSYAPAEPDRPVFYAYRGRWWHRWRVHASLHWMGEYQMDFDSTEWKVRHVWGMADRDVRQVIQP